MNNQFTQLLKGETKEALIGVNTLPYEPLLFPGSFNPFHVGHRKLFNAAMNISGRIGVLELSIFNTDKSSLDIIELKKRLDTIPSTYPVVVTRFATFIEKVEYFPNAWFVLGFDTISRLLNPKYYDNMEDILTRFKKLGTRFFVGGRIDQNQFKNLEDLDIPVNYRDLFISIPEEIFREDLSSSQIRKTN